MTSGTAVLVWVLIAIFNAWLAQRKGLPPGLWFVASLIAGPVATGAILFAVIPPRRGPTRFRLRKPEH